jgi:hypothetical protein
MVIELSTSMPLEECAQRLRAALASELVRGRLDGTRLVVTRPISYRNSFQTRLVADLIRQNGHTRIRCKFGMHPFVKVFMVVWLLILFRVGGGDALMSLFRFSGRVPSAEDLIGGLFPGMMMIFGLGVLAVGRFIARGEKDFLIAFLRDTIKAEPTSSVQGPP